MKQYILNIGHKTIGGDVLSLVDIETAVSRVLHIEAHRVVTGEYNGAPEETSVIRVTTGATITEVRALVSALCDELNQECVAVLFCDGPVAVGWIDGPNPSALTFDFAFFRM